MFPVSVLGRADSDGDAGRRYRNADPDDQLPVILPEDVVMDGITSPLKQIRSGQKLPLTVCQRCVNRHFRHLYGVLLVLCALHLPEYKEGMLDSEAANYWLPVDITLVVSNTPLCTCSTSASSTTDA